MLDYLGSRAAVDMIELFCKNPEKEFFSKEVGEKLGLSKATNIKWLKCLTRKGILLERSRGRKKFYKIRQGNPLARQIRVLVTITELVSALAHLSDMKAAYLVGSSSRGVDAPDSPVELLVLNHGDSRHVEKILKDVSSEIGRDIDARIMTPWEYAELSKDNPTVHERLEKEKIRLTFP